MTVQALVGYDAEQALSSVFQCSEFDSETLDLVERRFRQDFRLDVPVHIKTSGLEETQEIRAMTRTDQGAMMLTRLP